eukprot:TRINITY_DN43407_c0_g1_i1.p1 TRINITY_DN43407_c0_g1~~TRINITY_DN43407_c0_g1_i1.p1  ORF type:complete len:355 (+),score=28.54 TRINITY_DN43407_c0_g1_i1:107-1171(+)
MSRESMFQSLSTGYAGHTGRASLLSTVSAGVTAAFSRRPSKTPLPDVNCRKCRRAMDLKGPCSTAVQRWCDVCRQRLKVSTSRFSCKHCGRFICHSCGEKIQAGASSSSCASHASGAATGPEQESTAAGAGDDPEHTCVICFVEPDGVMFIPCRHNNFCRNCARRLRQCPLCMSVIESRQLADNGSTVVELDGRTEMHKAADEGRVRDVARFLDEGVAVDICTDSQLTPLHIAASQGHADVAQCLLSAGAIVCPRDASGSTPLHFAASYGKGDVVEALLATGRCEVNAQDSQAMTPLHWAARMAHEEIALALLCARADLNAKSCHSPGYTPFAMAEDWGTSSITELLRANGGHR